MGLKDDMGMSSKFTGNMFDPGGVSVDTVGLPIDLGNVMGVSVGPGSVTGATQDLLDATVVFVDPRGVTGIQLGLVDLTTSLLDAKGVFGPHVCLGLTHGLDVHHVRVDIPSWADGFSSGQTGLACFFFGLEGSLSISTTCDS